MLEETCSNILPFSNSCNQADAKFDVTSDESQYSAPTPEEGKALIYFVADGHLTSPFGVNGKWVGAVNGGRYFIVAIDPGEPHICAMLQSFLPLRDPKYRCIH